MEPIIRRSALDLLDAARHSSTEAVLAFRPAQRYSLAHLAALRAAAAVLAEQSAIRSANRTSKGSHMRPSKKISKRQGPRSAWALLAEVRPEFSEWSELFAAGAGKRAAAEAGLDVVTAREADDLVRDVEMFIALVEATLGIPHQVGLSLGRRAG